MNRIYAAAALTMLTGLAAPAHAEAPVLRAAVIGGLERTDSAPGSGADDGLYYGVQLGADWDLGGIKAGIEADLGDSTAKTPNGGNQAKQSVFASAAVRLAVPVTDATRVFVRGGAVHDERPAARRRLLPLLAMPAHHGIGVQALRRDRAREACGYRGRRRPTDRWRARCA